MAYFTKRQIAEKIVDEDIINLLIVNQKLLKDYNLFLQNVTLNGDKSVEIVIQSLEQTKTDTLLLELIDKDTNNQDIEIIDLITSMCVANEEGFDSINLFAA